MSGRFRLLHPLAVHTLLSQVGSELIYISFCYGPRQHFRQGLAWFSTFYKSSLRRVRMVQWREHSSPTNVARIRLPDSHISDVLIVLALRGVTSGVLHSFFSPYLLKQNIQIQFDLDSVSN